MGNGFFTGIMCRVTRDKIITANVRRFLVSLATCHLSLAHTHDLRTIHDLMTCVRAT
jgi:hypothetical protein